MNDTPKERVLFLDGLRATATVAVLLQHYLEIVAHETFLPFLQFAPGVFGVVLFFCISGYVIPFSVKNGLHPARFLLRRVFRIFPLFIATITAMSLLALFGVEPFATRMAQLDAYDYLANYLLMFEYVGAPPILGVAWTLSVELAWYLVFMVYFLRFGHRRVTEASLLFSAGMVALAVLCLVSETRAPLGRFGMIGAAFLGYVFCCWHLGRITGQRALWAVSAFAIATVISQWVSFGYFAHPHMTLFNAMSAWLLALVVFVLTAAGLPNHRIWRNPILRHLGRLSFGVYLLHMPVFQLLQSVLNGMALVILAALVTAILAEMAYRWIEQPAIELGKRQVWRGRAA